MSEDGASSVERTEQYEFRDVVSGQYAQARTDSEAAARQMAAQKIGADPSDLRRIYDHSGREAEDTEFAAAILDEALEEENDGE